jgi:hypothetical protein
MELKLGSNPTLPFDEDILGFSTYDKRGSTVSIIMIQDLRSITDAITAGSDGMEG